MTSWAERRRAVADRWPLDGMPMTRFEMWSAVEWDAIVKGDPKKAEYHRRGLLNAVAELLDQLDISTGREAGLDAERLIEEARGIDRTTIYWGEEWVAAEFLRARLAASPVTEEPS